MSVIDRESRSFRIAAMWRALRPHQWAKNALLFVPMLLAHEVMDLGIWLAGAIGFVVFSLCASSAYVINDVVDREADRKHRTKRHRPFASGALSPGTAYVMAPLLLLAAFGLATAFLPSVFLLTVMAYVVMTLAYSFSLKRLPIIDVLVLASLYTLRILAGGAATDVVVSQWALAFSMFFFLSLAMLKRYSELRQVELAPDVSLSGRGYRGDDLVLLRSTGPAAGFLSIMILALYVTTPEVLVLYQRPSLLWVVGALLVYWILRIWMKAHRGEMHDDPVLFATKDRPSYVVGILTLVTLVAATL